MTHNILVSEYGPAEVLQHQAAEALSVAPNTVLVKTHASGVNRVDTYMRSGKNGYTPDCPFTPGLEASGTITAVGQGVEGFEVNQRVFCFGSLTGTYADQILCQPDQLYHLPDFLTLEEGACLAIAGGTAFHALFDKAQITAGQKVLIRGGSGGVGTFGVLFAHREEATVVATAGSEEGLALLRRMGVLEVYNHKDAGCSEALKAHEGSFDIILETAAEKNLAEDLTLLNTHGKVIVIGSQSETTINPRLLMQAQGHIMGVALPKLSADTKRSLYQRLTDYMVDHKIKPIMKQAFPLSEASQAHKSLEDKPAAGNLILVTQTTQ